MLTHIIASQNIDFDKSIQNDIKNYEENLLDFRISKLQEDPNTGGFFLDFKPHKIEEVTKSNRNSIKEQKYIRPSDHFWDFKIPTFSDTNDNNFQFYPVLQSQEASIDHHAEKNNNSLMSKNENVYKNTEQNLQTPKAYSDADISKCLDSNNDSNIKLSEPVDQKELESQLKFFELPANKQLEIFIGKTNVKKQIVLTNQPNIQSLPNSFVQSSKSIKSKSNTEELKTPREENMVSTDKTQKIIKENSKNSFKQNNDNDIFYKMQLKNLDCQNNDLEMSEKSLSQKDRQQALFSSAQKSASIKNNIEDDSVIIENQQLIDKRESLNKHNEVFIEKKQDIDNILNSEDYKKQFDFDNYQPTNTISELDFRINRINEVIQNQPFNFIEQNVISTDIGKINNSQRTSNQSSSSKKPKFLYEEKIRTSKSSKVKDLQFNENELEQVQMNKLISSKKDINQFNDNELIEQVQMNKSQSSKRDINRFNENELIEQVQMNKLISSKKDINPFNNNELIDENIQINKLPSTNNKLPSTKVIENQIDQLKKNKTPKKRELIDKTFQVEISNKKDVIDKNIQTIEPEVKKKIPLSPNKKYNKIDNKLNKQMTVLQQEITQHDKQISKKKENIKQRDQIISEQNKQLENQFNINEQFQILLFELNQLEEEKKIFENNFQISQKEYVAEENNIDLQQKVITEKLVNICLSSRSVEKKINESIEKNYEERNKINKIIISYCGKIFGYSSALSQQQEQEISSKFNSIKNLQELQKKLYSEFKILKEEQNKIRKTIEEEQVLSEKYRSYQYKKQILKKEISDSEKEYNQQILDINKKIEIVNQNMNFYKNYKI